MAAQTTQEEIQPLAQTKRMLGMAEKDGLACAFALTRDKKECVLLIAKGSPKKASATLKADGKATLDFATMRFGRVEIDVAGDPGTVKFTVNRSEAGGTIMHMMKLVKKAGYQGLVINADDALENEAEDGEPPAPPPPPGAAAPIDAAALKSRLTALVQKMVPAIAADPARKDALLALAKKAQIMLGTNNLQTATQHVDELETLLDQAPTSAPTDVPATAAGAVTYAKSRLAWQSTRKKVAAELDRLVDSLGQQYDAEGSGDIVRQRVRLRLGEKLDAFDDSLADKLDEAGNEADPSKRETLIKEAKAIVSRYQSYLASEPLFAIMDKNPFAPTAVAKTMAATLQALSAAIR